MEAEHEAIPKSLEESLEIHKTSSAKLDSLAETIERANSPKERNLERLIGFALAICASLAAALIWWFVTGSFPILKS